MDLLPVVEFLSRDNDIARRSCLSRSHRTVAWLVSILIILLCPAGRTESCLPVVLQAQESLPAEWIKTGVWGNTVNGVKSTNVYRRVSSTFMTRVNSSLTSLRTCSKSGWSVETYPIEYRQDQVVFDEFAVCPHVNNSQVVFEGTNIFSRDDRTCMTYFDNGRWVGEDCSAFGCPEPRERSQCSSPILENLLEICWTATELKLKYLDIFQQALDMPYTTEELIFRVRTNVMDEALYPYPVVWSDGAARLELSCRDRVANASRLRYRLGLQTERDVRYRVKWEEVARYFNGAVIRSPQSQYIDGTGEYVYINREIAPPGRPGRIWAQLGKDGGAQIVFPSLDTNGFAFDATADAAFGVVPGSGEPGGGCANCGLETAGLSSGPRFSLSLGQSGLGPVGELEIGADEPSPQLATPAALTLNSSLPELEIVRDAQSGELRQIGGPQTFVDIVTVNAFRFEVRFYLPGQVGPAAAGGLRPIRPGEQPYVVWVFENPDHSPTLFNRWKVTEIRDGEIARVFLAEYDAASNTWRMTRQESTGNGLRIDESTREFKLVNNVGYTVETSAVRWPGGAEVFRLQRTYRHHDGRLYLIEERFGPPATPETTIYEYAFEAPGGAAGVPLLRKIGPYGYWERYDYDAGRRLMKRASPAGDAPLLAPDHLSVVTTYDYSPVGQGSGDDPNIQPDVPRTIIESMNGVEVSRRYHFFKPGEEWEVLCPDPYAAWDDERNVTTITRRFVSGPDQYRIQSVQHANGTTSYYRYQETPDERAIEVSTGEPNQTGDNLLNGTRVITVRDRYTGNLISRSTVHVANAQPVANLAREIYSVSDPSGRTRRVAYLDGSYSEAGTGCCGLDWSIDRDGVKSVYSYDPLNRRTATTRLGITTRSILDPMGRAVAEFRIGQDNSVMMMGRTLFDSAGRIVRETNALGGVTVRREEMDAQRHRVRTTIYPDGGTRIETYLADGELGEVTGTAVAPVRYVHGVEVDEGFYRRVLTEIKLDENGLETPEWSRQFRDGIGRTCKTVYPGDEPVISRVDFNRRGQVVRTVDPDNVTMLFRYDSLGSLEFSCVDSNRNDRIDFDGQDRIRRTLIDIVDAHGTTVRRTRDFIWNADNVDVPTILRTREVSLDGLRTWIAQEGGVTATTIDLPTAGNGWTRTVTEKRADDSSVIQVFRDGRLASLSLRDSSNRQVTGKTCLYDAHGRIGRVTDAKNGVTSYVYDNADHVRRVTTPLPANGETEQTTETVYDSSLRPVLVIKPDGRRLVREYYPTGLLKESSGARPFPARYVYDAQGRLAFVTTWRDYSRNSEPATTAWSYDPARGWLVAKYYPDDFGDPFLRGPALAYTPAGRIRSRTWARNVSTFYDYNDAGESSGVRYDDGLTPGTVIHRDREGVAAVLVRDGITTRLDASTFAQEPGEHYTGGALDNIQVQVTPDEHGRLQAITVKRGVLELSKTAFDYDAVSRLRSVTHGSTAIHYGYGLNSSLVNALSYEHNGRNPMSVRQQTDALDRLMSIISEPAADTSVGYWYQYDHANRRVRTDWNDGSYWTQDYDKLGQLEKGNRYWDDGRPVAGQQFEYSHDDAGNRRSAGTGGNGSNGVLREARYEANAANQYLWRTVPPSVGVAGAAGATADVRVNDQDVTARRGEYFWKELPVNNSEADGGGPLWLEFVIQAADVATTNENRVAGHLYVPQSPEQFDYDADGNLLRDDRWNYQWDAENRLIRMATRSRVGPQWLLAFDYDWRGRRIGKRVWSNATGDGPPLRRQTCIYHGWNLILVLDGNGDPEQSFHWGLDLSGNKDGAGGIGGLLASTLHAGTNAGTYFFAYDGNGNVVGLVNAADGTWAARYEYGPFGELIRSSGPVARENPFRFSTKWQDDETDLVYYGYRFYSASLGRWINRDPIGESGGENLYAFVGNQPSDVLDLYGLTWVVRKVQGQAFPFETASKSRWAADPVRIAIESQMTESSVTAMAGGSYSGFFGFLENIFDNAWPLVVTATANLSCDDQGNIRGESDSSLRTRDGISVAAMVIVFRYGKRATVSFGAAATFRGKLKFKGIGKIPEVAEAGFEMDTADLQLSRARSATFECECKAP